MMVVLPAALLIAASPLPLDRRPDDPLVAAPVPDTGQTIKSRIVSPDGQWTAFLFGRPESSARTSGDTLWLQSEATLELTCLFGRECGAPDRQSWDIGTPTFDDGAAALYFPAVSDNGNGSAIFAAGLEAQTLRSVTEGSSVAIVRDGPYRGDLIVERNGARGTNAFVVRPDGRELLQIPPSDTQASGQESSKAWLAANGWRAW